MGIIGGRYVTGEGRWGTAVVVAVCFLQESIWARRQEVVGNDGKERSLVSCVVEENDSSPVILLLVVFFCGWGIRV